MTKSKDPAELTSVDPSSSTEVSSTPDEIDEGALRGELRSQAASLGLNPEGTIDELQARIAAVPQPEPDPAPGVLPEGKYVVGFWAKVHPNYGCPYCPFLTLDGDSAVDQHILERHPERVAIDDIPIQ